MKLLDHKSIGEFFKPLYKILEDFNISSFDKWSRIGAIKRKVLMLEIALFYRESLNDIVSILELSQGITLSFDKFNPNWNNSNKVAKKAVFYSDVSIVIIESEVKINGVIEDERHYKRTGIKRQFANIESGSLKFLIKVLLDIKLLVLKGIVLPIPINLNFDAIDGFINYNSSSHIITNSIVNRYNDLVRKIKMKNLSNYTIPISLDNWKIKRQIEEIQEFTPSVKGLKPVHLYLPYLTNLDLDTLIGLREDNYDYFFRYQQALKDFILNTPKVNSENAFIEIARKVNFEIEELTEKVGTLGSELKRKGSQLVIGTGVSLMTLLIDAELASYLSSFIGAKTALDILPYFSLKQKNKISNNAYYMAYLTQQKGESKIDI